jgi:hypothetical protein
VCLYGTEPRYLATNLLSILIEESLPPYFSRMALSLPSQNIFVYLFCLSRVRKCIIFVLLRCRIPITLQVFPHYFHSSENIIKGNCSVYNIVVGEEPADCSLSGGGGGGG